MQEAQALLARGRYLAALRLAGPIATDPARLAAGRVQAAFLAVQAAAALGLYQEAQRYATLARDQAVNEEELAKALHYLGAVLLWLHNYDQAESALLTALAQEGAAHLATARPAILHNLALTYQMQRQDPLAIKVFRQAGEAFEATAQPGEAVDSWQNAAWLELLAGRASQARSYLERSARHLNSAGADEQLHQRALEAYTLLLEGDRQSAGELAEEILQFDRGEVTPWARAMAAMTAAEVALVEGRLSLARALAQNAAELAGGGQNVRLMTHLVALRRRVGA